MEKNISLFPFLFISSLYLTSCNSGENPVAINFRDNTPKTVCSFQGMELQFNDSCTYEFITSFIAQYDSVEVIEAHLGCTFYLYAKEGDKEYWQKIFEKDSTLQQMFLYYRADSLFIQIKVTGKKSLEVERQRFTNVEKLEVVKIEEYPKLVYVDVPENSAARWEEYFKQYPFVEHTFRLFVCYV